MDASSNFSKRPDYRLAMFWKDSRVCLGLWGVCVVMILMATMQACLYFLDPGLIRDFTNFFVPLAIVVPGLFAMSIGSILIGGESVGDTDGGQDRDSLDWLLTLPVPWQSIWIAKWRVAILGLISLWLLTAICICYAAFHLEITWGTAELWDFAKWLALTAALQCFVMSVGVYFAWAIRSQVHAMLTTVGVLFLTWLVGAPLLSALVLNLEQQNPEPAVFGFTLIFGTLFVVLSYRASKKRCLPTVHQGTLIHDYGVAEQREVVRSRNDRRETPRDSDVNSPYGRVPQAAVSPLRMANGVPPTHGDAAEKRFADLTPGGVALMVTPPRPVYALLWQHFIQAMPLILTAGGLMLLAIAALILNDFVRIDMTPWVAASWFGGTAWIGVSACMFDTMQRRVHFFVDRGISPILVYFSRMLIPCIVFAGCWITLSILAVISFGGSEFHEALLFGGMLTFFSSVLMGMLFRKPILAMTSALAVSAILMGVFAWGMGAYHGEILAVVIIPLLCLIASMRLFGIWMNQNQPNRLGVLSLAWISLGVLLYFGIVLGIRYATIPAENAAFAGLVQQREVLMDRPMRPLFFGDSSNPDETDWLSELTTELEQLKELDKATQNEQETISAFEEWADRSLISDDLLQRICDPQYTSFRAPEFRWNVGRTANEVKEIQILASQLFFLRLRMKYRYFSVPISECGKLAQVEMRVHREMKRKLDAGEIRENDFAEVKSCVATAEDRIGLREHLLFTEWHRVSESKKIGEFISGAPPGLERYRAQRWSDQAYGLAIQSLRLPRSVAKNQWPTIDHAIHETYSKYRSPRYDAHLQPLYKLPLDLDQDEALLYVTLSLPSFP